MAAPHDTSLHARLNAIDLTHASLERPKAEAALWQHLSALGAETDSFEWVDDVEQGLEALRVAVERGTSVWEPSSSRASWNRISVWHPDRRVSYPDRELRQRGDHVGAPIIAAARGTLGRRWRVRRTSRTERRWRERYALVPAPASVHRLAVAAADEEALVLGGRSHLDDFAGSPGALSAKEDEMRQRWRWRHKVRTYESACYRAPVLEPLVRALEHGLLFFWVVEGRTWRQRRCVCVPRPALHLRNGRLHRDDAPAVAWATGVAYWFWEGVSIPRRVLHSDGTVRRKALVWTTNAERRRLLLERLGPQRFLAAADGTVVAQDDFGRLWRTTLHVDGEPLTIVEVPNATVERDGTRRSYWLRVPPTVRTAREAVAWTFGFDSTDDYLVASAS